MLSAVSTNSLPLYDYYTINIKYHT